MLKSFITFFIRSEATLYLKGQDLFLIFINFLFSLLLLKKDCGFFLLCLPVHGSCNKRYFLMKVSWFFVIINIFYIDDIFSLSFSSFFITLSVCQSMFFVLLYLWILSCLFVCASVDDFIFTLVDFFVTYFLLVHPVFN